MHRHLDEELLDLRQRLVAMGTVAETMIRYALRTLLERNEAHCQEVHKREQEVDAMEIEVDDLAIRLTALHAPVGSDIRFLFMATRISGEIERIADQAVNVCQNSHHYLAAPPLKPLVVLPIMADVVQAMVRESLQSLVLKDCTLAEHVLEEEKKVDAYKDQIFRELLTYMMADPGTIHRALALILISRNLERIGDHATNIAEEVIYWIQARDIRHHHTETSG